MTSMIPLVPLERNPCGKPSAGRPWERKLEDAVLQEGWEKVPNWESLHHHRQCQLFPSSYVVERAPVW